MLYFGKDIQYVNLVTLYYRDT